LENAHERIRAHVPPFARDRLMAPAIAETSDLVAARAFESLLGDLALPSA
jgi:histidine ammonia-lyase